AASDTRRRSPRSSPSRRRDRSSRSNGECNPGREAGLRERAVPWNSPRVGGLRIERDTLETPAAVRVCPSNCEERKNLFQITFAIAVSGTARRAELYRKQVIRLLLSIVSKNVEMISGRPLLPNGDSGIIYAKPVFSII